MSRDNKTRDLTPSPNWTQNERVNLFDSSEQIRFKKGYQLRKGRSRDVHYSASTNAWGFVSLLLLIGLIATMFFAYYNSSRTDGKFQYFSPSEYLSKLGSQQVVIPAGEYEVTSILEGWNGAIADLWRGHVDLYGMLFISTNRLTASQVPFRQFTFDIFGHTVESYFGTNEDGVQVRYITLPEDIETTVNEMPQLTIVMDAWQNVSDFGSFGTALAGTASFVVEYYQYQKNLFQNLLPWNSVVEDETGYLESLWERGQS